MQLSACGSRKWAEQNHERNVTCIAPNAGGHTDFLYTLYFYFSCPLCSVNVDARKRAWVL